jgi:hypothetical protein
MGHEKISWALSDACGCNMGNDTGMDGLKISPVIPVHIFKNTIKGISNQPHYGYLVQTQSKNLHQQVLHCTATPALVGIVMTFVCHLPYQKMQNFTNTSTYTIT